MTILESFSWQSCSVLYEHLSDIKKILWLSPLEISAAQLCSVTEIAPISPFLMCEQKSYLVWFSCTRHKSYPVSGYEHLSDMWLSSLEIGAARSSFAPLQKSRRYQPFLCVNRSPIWYGFRAGEKTIWYSGNIALAGLGIVCYTAVFRVVTRWGALRDDTRNGCVAD